MPIIKRTVANIIILSVFVAVSIIIIIPLLAELARSSADRLAAGYKWTEAEESFKRAIRLDTLNPGHKAGLADFLITQARYRDDKKSLLSEAAGLYGEAARLNPRCARYRFALGEIYLREIILGLGSDIGMVMKNFRDAVREDPNGLNISYMTGYAAISIWGSLGEGDREFVLDRLRYAVKISPHFGKYVYAKLWRRTKDFSLLKDVTPPTLEANRRLYAFLAENNLWQSRKEQASAVELYYKKEEPGMFELERDMERKRLAGLKAGPAGRKAVISQEDWRGKDASGRSNYEYGGIYWAGTVDAVIDAPSGKAVVKIEAKATPAGGVYPYIVVRLDAREIGEAFVDSSEWKEYAFPVDTEGGRMVLSVTFLNDAMDEAKKEDRNLFLKGAVIE